MSIKTHALIAGLLLMRIILGNPPMLWAADDSPPDVVQHRLLAILAPAEHQLTVQDQMMLAGVDGPSATLNLAENVQLKKVAVNGQQAEWSFKRGRLQIALPRQQEKIELTVAYQGRFDESVPVQPLNTDNPGYGVLATIQQQGTMVLAGSAWYPDMDGVKDQYDLTIDAPEGVMAITVGKPKGHISQNGRTRSRWLSYLDIGSLPLVAGRYKVATRKFGRVTAATYFSRQLQQLSADYLAATGRYLQLYEKMFGPYPFAQFAVVENFFPTGYGFPSFTLMGRRVLQLPFIIHTSLGHEIAHCWWGNGVFVDASSGNWSEGLTSYVADYLYKERSGEGRSYRQQWLRNYASIVDAQYDFALSRFTHRSDPVTKVVGYDKGAMVFHMLRHQLGDELFWATLRHIYARYLFEAVSWKEIQTAFEKQSGRSLERFFEQWVYRPGAPILSLAEVTASKEASGYAVTGQVLQKSPYFDLELELELTTTRAPRRKTIAISGARTAFSMASPVQPLVLRADADTQLFRRLAQEEVPPTINHLRGASEMAVIVARALGRQGLELARRVETALGLHNAKLGFEDQFSAADLSGRDLLVIGRPANRKLIRVAKAKWRIEPDGFELLGRRYTSTEESLFGVDRDGSGHLRAFFLPGPHHAAVAVSTKIPHYGKYSYLVFEGALNRVKGTWRVIKSPLTVRLDAVSSPD
jgi:hypothetical protein